MSPRPRTRLALSVVMLSAIALIGIGSSASAQSTQSDLATVRSATAAFHNPANARAAGYLPTTDCVAVPGLGVMGQHWVNPDLFAPKLDAAHPQALLYAPTANGVRLVAVEYIVFAPKGTPLADHPEQPDRNGPALFGQFFNGVMEGHPVAGPIPMPNHWDLHVWLWAHNPAGTFAQFNPSKALSC